MAFFGGMQNPSSMNSAFYQQLLSMMQGSQMGGMGGPGIGMSAQPNMAPQIAQQHQPTSNISPVPQPPKPAQGPAGGAVGGAVQAGNNLTSLYGMGNKAYNGVAGMFGSGQPPAGGQGAYVPGQSGYGMGGQAPQTPQMTSLMNGQPAMGAPQAGMQQGMGQAGMPAGMQGGNAAAQSYGAQPFFGSNTMGAMYGAGGMPAGAAQGTMANYAPTAAPTSSMFGSMGASGTTGTTAGTGLATGAAGTSGTTASASSSSPLSQVLSWLGL